MVGRDTGANDASEAALDSFTGWTIAVLGLGVLVLVWGAIFTFTVYAEALADSFGLSSLRVSSVFSITTAAFFIAGGAVGVLVARLPLRPVVTAVGVTVGVAIGALQVVSSYAGLVLVFGLIGVAGGTMLVVVLSVVPLWFEVYEGRAMGITMTGNGLGVLLLPFVWVWLLDRTDIRTAFFVVGGGIVAVVLLASLVYRRPPGARRAETTPIDVAWLRSKLTDPRFGIALVGFALMWSWYFVLSAALVDILTTKGIARTAAATAFGTIGGISVLTRVASGGLADRIGMRVTLAAGVVLAALGVFLLIGTDSRRLMYLTLAVFGTSLGAVATLFAPIIIRGFGPENATAIVGLFTIAQASTAFLAPLAMNVLVASTGGYTLPLALLGVVTLVGVGLFHWGTDTSRAGTASGS